MGHVVLFVDDEPLLTAGLKRALRKEPYEILSANSAVEALKILGNREVDVIVSDEQMPGMSGSEFLAVVRERMPETIRIMLTGQASLESAIRAINEGGIYRFITKPCNEADLAVTIRQALQQKDLMNESQRLLKISKQQFEIIKQLERETRGIADLDKNETGTIILDAPLGDINDYINELSKELSLAEKKLDNLTE